MRRFINKAIWLIAHKVPWKPILIWGPWIVVLLVVGFYGIENWRGARLLQRAKEQATAAGISLRVQDHLPTRPPTALIPETLPGFDGQKIPGIRRVISDRRAGFDLSGAGKKAARSTNRWQAKRRNIQEWLDPASGITSEKEAATEIDRLVPEFQILRQLVNQYQEQPLVFLPESSAPSFHEITSLSFMSMLTVSLALRDDTTIAVSLRDQERVFENLLLMQEILASEQYPSLLSLMFKSAITTIWEDAIWEVISADLLSNEQLKILSQKSHHVSFTQLKRAALEGELVFMLESCTSAKRNREELVASLSWTELSLFSKIETGWAFFDDAMLEIDELFWKTLPSGWVDLAAANLIYDLVSFQKELIVNPSAISHPGADKSHWPAKLYTQEMTSMIYKSMERANEAMATLRLSRIGIELALFKRETGTYPASLQELPNLNLTDTMDPIANKAMGYRIKPDGTPHLWSVGRNQIDEGGLPSSSRRDGDIVWMLSPIPGLTESQWKKNLKNTKRSSQQIR